MKNLLYNCHNYCINERERERERKQEWHPSVLIRPGNSHTTI